MAIIMAPPSCFHFDHYIVLYCGWLYASRHSGATEIDYIFGLLIVVSCKGTSLTVNVAGEWQFNVDLNTPAPSALAAALASSS
jgi:hypothetical protein